MPALKKPVATSVSSSTGMTPIFLSGATQGIFECVADVNVTAAAPTKLIKKDAIMDDIKKRAAVSDLKPYMDSFQNYAGAEILFVYDAEFEFGQNFTYAPTEEVKAAEMKRLTASASGDESKRGDASTSVMEDSIAEEVGESSTSNAHIYKPPESKPWVSLGSEKEIFPFTPETAASGKKIKLTITRRRKLFGNPVVFDDREPKDVKDGYMECLPYEDRAYETRRMEMDRACQHVAFTVDTGAQTEFQHPRAASTQSHPRQMTDEQLAAELESERLADALQRLAPSVEAALQQNEIANVFVNDWTLLSADGSSIGSEAGNNLQEFQSFTDLVFSKDKLIGCIDWHPTFKGVVGVSVVERLTFNERIDAYSRLIMNPSLILIWSFSDPIHPQLLLEAPDDIFCFQFNPSDPNIIAGGCINGQIVLWDISAHADRLKPSKSNRPKRQQKSAGDVDFDAESEGLDGLECPLVRYAAVSAIEQSHKSCVTDLQWLPDHFEVSKLGAPLENSALRCCQVMSCASDQVVLFWDIRPPVSKTAEGGKNAAGGTGGAGGAGTMSSGSVITTSVGGGGGGGDKKPDTPIQSRDAADANPFKHLDLTWKPLLKVTLPCSDPGGDFAPTKFSIQERMGDRAALEGAVIHDGDDEDLGGVGDPSYVSPGRTSGAEPQKLLSKVSTKFYIGTEDGHLVYVDWKPAKDNDTGKVVTQRASFWSAVQDGAVVTLQRNPFYKDIILCVGGWNFTVWKEGVHDGPLLRSAVNTHRLTCAHWSPSRPGVFYVAKSDGSVDIWDLLDRTHEPSLTQTISAAPVTSIFPKQVSSKKQMLAIGDGLGTLHILEIPRSLVLPSPNEEAGVAAYFAREVERSAFGKGRWETRAREKRDREKAEALAQVALKNTPAPPSEEEIEEKMRAEYKAYLELEKSILIELGLWVDKDEEETE